MKDKDNEEAAEKNSAPVDIGKNSDPIRSDLAEVIERHAVG
jgi:hypothetical protein